MSDYFFKQYYNDVRDPLWPNISTYNEFLKLPTHIINECRRDLGLDSRLAELENREYWLTHGAHNEVYLFGNIGYVPTYKCAHSYYVNLFTELGWKKLRLSDIDVNNYQLFGLMINPYVRRLKGITQTLLIEYQFNYPKLFSDLQSQLFKNFILKVMITDAHTVPYTITYGRYFKHINWIPMDILTDTELTKTIEKFTGIILPRKERINQSSENQLKVFKILEENFLLSEPDAELGLLFSDDVKYYNRLIENYERI